MIINTAFSCVIYLPNACECNGTHMLLLGIINVRQTNNDLIRREKTNLRNINYHFLYCIREMIEAKIETSSRTCIDGQQ